MMLLISQALGGCPVIGALQSLCQGMADEHSMSDRVLLHVQLAALRTQNGNAPVETEAESWAQKAGHLAPSVTMHAVFHAAMSESNTALLAAALRWVSQRPRSCIQLSRQLRSRKCIEVA